MTSPAAAFSQIHSRLTRLNMLSLAIEKHHRRTDAFNALDPQDRTRILGVLKIGKFDWTSIEKKGLKGRIQSELQTMTKKLRSLSLRPAPRYSFPFTQVPKAVMTTIVSTFLTPKDLAAFYGSFKDASNFNTVSHIIKHYHLEPHIETYLHTSSVNLLDGAKAKLLDALMTFAYKLSNLEKLPRPCYSSLGKFFALVEARNLIRMAKSIHHDQPFPGLDKTLKSLKIPKNPKTAIRKAELIRKWIAQHPDFLPSIDEHLDLKKSNLTLLPKEIGLLKAIRWLWLNDNRLTTLPKEIGALRLYLLSLSNNLFDSLPKEIAQMKKTLEVLYLGGNCFKVFPKEVWQLPLLTRLWLNNNILTALPKEIGRLKLLQWLIITHNYLNTLPKELGQMKYLFRISFNGNSIVELPKGLEKFGFELKEQNKKRQLKTLLDRMMLSLKNGHNCKAIGTCLALIENLVGKDIRVQLEYSLYEECKKASKTNPKLYTKLKNPKFGLTAFTDKKVDPKFKAIAVAKLWKALEKRVL